MFGFKKSITLIISLSECLLFIESIFFKLCYLVFIIWCVCGGGENMLCCMLALSKTFPSTIRNSVFILIDVILFSDRL